MTLEMIVSGVFLVVVWLLAFWVAFGLPSGMDEFASLPPEEQKRRREMPAPVISINEARRRKQLENR
jgi:hypothetical protein